MLTFLSCEHDKLVLLLGPLHGLFPLPGVLFQLTFAWQTQVSAQASPPRAAFPGHPVPLRYFILSHFYLSTCHYSIFSCSQSSFLLKNEKKPCEKQGFCQGLEQCLQRVASDPRWVECPPAAPIHLSSRHTTSSISPGRQGHASSTFLVISTQGLAQLPQRLGYFL